MPDATAVLGGPHGGYAGKRRPNKPSHESKTGILVFAVGDRPSQKRASAPRVRSGCKQCKRRHLKCDEGQPACQRCLTSGLTCTSFQALASSRTTVSLVSWPTRAAQATVSVPLGAPNYESTLFRDQQQWDAFHHFILMSDQGGTLPIAEIMGMTPQIAQGELSVRELCCGIGAYAKAVMGLDSPPHTFDRALYSSSAEYLGRAIKAVRLAKVSADSLMMAVVASFLFITFEVINDNMKAAFAHFSHAHSMMEQYLHLRCREKGLSFADLRLTPVETAVFDMLQRLTTHPWAYDMATSISGLTEHLQMCCRGQRQKYRVYEMPPAFDDSIQASKWLDITQHFIKHHLQRLKHGVAFPPDWDSRTTEELESTAWAQSFNAIRLWRAGLTPLLQSAQRTKRTNPHKYLQVETLEILYLEVLATLQKYHRDDSNILPATTPLYMDMVRTVRALPKVPTFESSEASDMAAAVVRPLAFVVYKCRDPEVLRELRSTLEDRQESSMATTLLAIMTCRENNIHLKAAERGWAWYFTCIGCSSGAMDIV